MARGETAMQIVSDTASVTQLVSNMTSSLSAIQRALKDMRDLPKELEGLQHIAGEGDRKILSVTTFLRREDWEHVLPSFNGLNKDLEVAARLNRQLAGTQNFGKDFITGLLGSGPSERLREAKRLNESIQLNLNIINGVILELVMRRLQLDMPQLASQYSQAPDQWEMVEKLQRLSKLVVEERIIQDVLSAPSHSASYRPLAAMEASVEGEGFLDEDAERGSVAGGYEVENNVKIRLTMKTEEPRFFYVVIFDSSNLTPQLFYPTIARARNQLQINRSAEGSNYKRTFPDPVTFRNDDPLSWKLIKATTLASDGVEACFVYVLFSSNRLEQDSQVPTIMDVKQKLDAEGSWEEEEIVVESLRFDVK